MVFSELTTAEVRVLELVAQGLSTRQIGAILWVSNQAVTYHISHMLQKLGAKNRAGLVARAYAAGVLDPNGWPPSVGCRSIRYQYDSTNDIGSAPGML